MFAGMYIWPFILITMYLKIVIVDTQFSDCFSNSSLLITHYLSFAVLVSLILKIMGTESMARHSIHLVTRGVHRGKWRSHS